MQAVCDPCQSLAGLVWWYVDGAQAASGLITPAQQWQVARSSAQAQHYSHAA